MSFNKHKPADESTSDEKSHLIPISDANTVITIDPGSNSTPTMPRPPSLHDLDTEAVKDRASENYIGSHEPDLREIQGHHALPSIYSGVQLIGDVEKENRSKSTKRSIKRRRNSRISDPRTSIAEAVLPSEQVQFLLGQIDSEDDCPAVFCELIELGMTKTNELEWREMARWVKFEEDVEPGGNRWSKPFVATLSLHSLLELRCCLQGGSMLLDMTADSFPTVVDLIIDDWINRKALTEYQRDEVSEILLKRHRHQHQRHHRKHANGEGGMSGHLGLRSIADIGRNISHSLFHHDTNSNQTLPSNQSAAKFPNSETHLPAVASESCLEKHNANAHFMKKIPIGAEAANIMVGEMDSLKKPIYSFIRLEEAKSLGDLTEVNVPTKFLFVLLGPRDVNDPKHTSFTGRYHEIGRAMGTIMSDEIFHQVAFKAKTRKNVLAGIDEFLDAVTVLPPAEWDPKIRIEPPSQVPSQGNRLNKSGKKDAPDGGHGQDPWLKRTGKLFGGLIQDVKRKWKHRTSDITDALSLQTIASVFFLYFATLTPVVAFGGLLGQATNNEMAAFESILSASVVGIAWAIFSGQPLVIMGSTGPVLVFETIMYNLCQSIGWEYLPLRLWYNFWIMIILFIMVATDASVLVKYITRFTEESFAALIGAIFIFKSFVSIWHINDHHAVLTNTDEDLAVIYNCSCGLVPQGQESNKSVEPIRYESFSTSFTEIECGNASVVRNGTTMVGKLMGTGCKYEPDVFFLSVCLFFGTYFISRTLKGFKTARYLPSNVRQVVSDFAVVIAIGIMTSVDLAYSINTPKLDVPAEFKPTKRPNWIVPFLGSNPWYSIPAAILPALLGTILIFMDQQITAVIVNRRENKLKKGAGYHLDLLVLAISMGVVGILGLPVMVAATVLSITHVQSLRLESETAAPGDKPQFLGIREQRVTTFFIYALIGCSMFLTPVLMNIPMPVLYGVFLYMGVSSLRGVQFVDRVKIMFMPQKYQPDYMYLRHVPLWRIHLFTGFQLAAFVVLWLLKSFKQTSILFPLMVLALVGVRKVLDYIFTRNELAILDDVQPETDKREKEDDEIAEQEQADLVHRRKSVVRVETTGDLSIPLTTGNFMKIPFKNAEKDELESDALVRKTDLFRSIASTGGFMDPLTSGDESDHYLKSRRKKAGKSDDFELRKRSPPSEEELGRDTKVTFRLDEEDENSVDKD